MNKRKNIIRTNDLLKDRRKEIRETIESIIIIIIIIIILLFIIEYGSESNSNSSGSDSDSSSEDEFKKFEREQILRGTSLVPNAEMISKEQMQQEVNQAVKSIYTYIYIYIFI